MQFATISSSSANPAALALEPGELRILLVEDSALLQARLIEMLTLPGQMRVMGVADTEAGALELTRSQTFDAMVVDVELRCGSGVAFVRRVRASQGQPPYPLIIILTNYNLTSVQERCLAAGADHFLDKAHEFERVCPLISAANA